MGYEYHIMKPRTNEWFQLGKGDFSKPLEEFAIWDLDQSIHITNVSFLEFSRFSFNRTMMSNNREEFINLYVGFFDEFSYTPHQSNEDIIYLSDVAGRLFDWIGEDDVFIYGDHAFEVFHYNEWTMTGTRYVEEINEGG